MIKDFLIITVDKINDIYKNIKIILRIKNIKKNQQIRFEKKKI